MKKIIKYILACGLFAVANGCSHDDLEVYKESDNFNNVVDFAQNNYDLSLFAAALEYAGLADTLRTAAGPLTVFAPSNAAYNELGVTTAGDFGRLNKDSLRDMLRIHILPRRLYKADVPDQTVENNYSNLAGLQTSVDSRQLSYPMGLYAGGAKVSRSDVVLANGVLHVLSKAIKYNRGKVTDVLESRKEYSLFTAALKRFGYWQQLEQGSRWTVMAVRDSVFEKAGITMQDIEAMDPAQYHARLWGSYLFKAKIPLSHMEVLDPPSGSGYYAYNSAYFRIPVEGDEAYSSGVSKLEKTFFIATTSPGTSNALAIADFGPAFRCDYLCSNGVVHDVKNLLVKPSEAKK